MDTRALQIFKTVASTGSISRAAADLSYVQSNVSGRIGQLEQELGTKLFHRKSRGVALTPAGRILEDYASRVLHLLDEARQAVQGSTANSGSLRIGALETTAAVRLPPILAGYHRTYPNVDLSLTTGHTGDLLDRIQDYALDGAFVGGSINHVDIVQEPVFEEELVLVAAAELGAVEDITAHALLVFRQGCTYRARAEQWVNAIGRVPAAMMEMGSVDALLGCAAAGMGITLLPRSVAERPQYRGLISIHAIAPELAAATTYFIRRRDSLPTPALSALVDMAKAR